MAEDKRKFRRCVMRLTLSYGIHGTKKIGKALTDNVSGVGLRFVAEHPLERGDRLDVVLHLPEQSEPIRCVAEVVWAQPHRVMDRALAGVGRDVGVKFVDMAPRDGALLAQYATLYGLPPEA